MTSSQTPALSHRRIAVTALITAVALASLACKKEQTVASRTASEEPPSAAVAKAKSLDLSQGLVLTAEFKPFQEVDVMAKVAGYVSSINVDAGSRVSQGQLLAVIEIPEMADDRARAQAALDRSQAELNRIADFGVRSSDAGRQQPLGDARSSSAT